PATHYTRFITTAKQSAPNRRIGTFGLTVGAACASDGRGWRGVFSRRQGAALSLDILRKELVACLANSFAIFLSDKDAAHQEDKMKKISEAALKKAILAVEAERSKHPPAFRPDRQQRATLQKSRREAEKMVAAFLKQAGFDMTKFQALQEQRGAELERMVAKH